MSDFMAVVIYSQGIRQFHSLTHTEAAVIWEILDSGNTNLWWKTTKRRSMLIL